MKIAFFRRLLQDTYSLIEVEEQNTALEWIKSTPINLIFLDLQSLTFSIVDFCPLIRRILGKKKVPIFLISRSIQKSLLEEFLRAGVSDFIHEPLDSDEIEERITIQLHSSQTNRKVSTITSKMKTPSLIPKNVEFLLRKTLIGSKALKTIMETKKTMHPLSLLVVQIDRFQQIEKELGATATGELKTELEKALKGHLRTHDFLLTEGPTTYLLLLPKTSQRAAKIIAEDLRLDVSSTTFKTSVSEVLITISTEVLSFEQNASESSKSFEQLELCLERIKQSLPKTHSSENTLSAKTP
jgi:diguanylate cyclase (GGDEF)-like protein